MDMRGERTLSEPKIVTKTFRTSRTSELMVYIHSVGSTMPTLSNGELEKNGKEYIDYIAGSKKTSAGWRTGMYKAMMNHWEVEMDRELPALRSSARPFDAQMLKRDLEDVINLIQRDTRGFGMVDPTIRKIEVALDQIVRRYL